jgi:hypothetical protein
MSTRNRRCRTVGLVAGSIWALVLSGNCFAQSTGTLQGRASDPNGGAIPDVLITLQNRSIGFERTIKTDPDGLHQIAGLAAGTYQMDVRAEGFRAQTADEIVIEAGRTITQDFQLQIGNLTQQLSVTVMAPLVDSVAASIGRVIDQSQVRDLPLNGRNFLELAQLEPAVAVLSTTNPGTLANNYSRVTVARSFFSEIRILIDGSTINDRLIGGTTQNFSQESVREFRISTFNFDLASGTPGAGVISVTSRRGENTVHGSGLFYYRDHNLAAYPGLARDSQNQSPFFARRQSGYSLGGPVKRDRLFWFGNYEHNNQDAVFTVNNNHPIFSKLDVIYPNPLTADTFNVRMDWTPSARSEAFFRFSMDQNRTIGPAATAGMPSNWQSLRNKALQLQAGLTSVVSARAVNVVRASYSYLNGQLKPVFGNECRDSSACIGLDQPAILVFDAPQLRIGKQANSPFPRWERNYQFVDDVAWQRGRHFIRLGGEWEHVYWKALFDFNDPAQITLWGPSNLQTPALRGIFDALPATLKDPNGPPPTLSDILQLPLRSFIMGIGNPTLPVPYNFDKASRNDRLRAYIEDAWRIRPDLTVNAGLAYSYETHLFHSDLQRPAYLAALMDGNLHAPQPDPKGFDPSVGLAWSPDRNRRTTIRLMEVLL